MQQYAFTIVCLLALVFHLPAQQTPSYEQAYQRLEHMLENTETASLKDAVFLVENTYAKGRLSKDAYDSHIRLLTTIALGIIDGNTLEYDYNDAPEVERHAALFRLMTDTVQVIVQGDTLYHMPFTYDFSDVFAEQDWQRMFVTKLLDTGTGNCHSLPLLYKILADELGIQVHLALAPNHIYLKSRSEKTGWYNTELTSASFPIDAWIMASGYVHLDAIRNGVYMKALDDKETLAMCVIDLAMGYRRATPDHDGAFVMQCCNLALEHFPNYITAILLKAQTLKQQIERMTQQHRVDTPKELIYQSEQAQVLWKEMEQLYFRAHRLGYRQMPKQMYLDWLLSLQTEREEYGNRKMTRFGE